VLHPQPLGFGVVRAEHVVGGRGHGGNGSGRRLAS
jgi:hypothetical protein